MELWCKTGTNSGQFSKFLTGQATLEYTYPVVFSNTVILQLAATLKYKISSEIGLVCLVHLSRGVR